MTVTFQTKILEEFYELPLAKQGSQGIDKMVIKGFKKKVDILKFATDLRTISQLNGLRLEKLEEEKYIGCYSIRVNKQYRIIFKEGPAGQLSILILELSKHYE